MVVYMDMGMSTDGYAPATLTLGSQGVMMIEHETADAVGEVIRQGE